MSIAKNPFLDLGTYLYFISFLQTPKLAAVRSTTWKLSSHPVKSAKVFTVLMSVDSKPDNNAVQKDLLHEPVCYSSYVRATE